MKFNDISSDKSGHIMLTMCWQMLKLTIMEKHGLQDRQDLVHRDVKRITSAVYVYW